MSVIALRRRITRLDHGVSPEMPALDKLTDDELHAHIRNRLRWSTPPWPIGTAPTFR
jgi:hypothetical protein